MGDSNLANRFLLADHGRTFTPMPLVYLTSSKRVFHRDTSCSTLTKDPELTAMDLRHVSGPVRPCLKCYPDAPRAKFVKRYCPECNPKVIQPCAHNGGEQVPILVRQGRQSLTGEPDDMYIRWRWVWPDRAHFYQRESLTA